MSKLFQIGKFKSGSEKNSFELVQEKENLQILNLQFSKGTTASFEDKKGKDVFFLGVVMSGEIVISYLNEKITLKVNDYIYYEKLEDLILVYIHENASMLVVSSMDIYSEYNNTADALYSMMDRIEEKDHYTKKHCDRVSRMCGEIARRLNYTNDQIYHLAYGAYFHDLGKINIDDEILNKKERLDDDESLEMRRHVEYSKILFMEHFTVLEDNCDFNLIGNIIIQHHERLGGSGYPFGLKGEAILQEAKIIAVCDSFDAMVTDRPYKRGKSKTEALKELKKLAGTKYNAEIVKLIEVALDEGYDDLYKDDHENYYKLDENQ